MAWGFLILFMFHFLHGFMFRMVLRMPRYVSSALAALLLVAYGVDFVHSLRRAFQAAHETNETQDDERWSL